MTIRHTHKNKRGNGIGTKIPENQQENTDLQSENSNIKLSNNYITPYTIIELRKNAKQSNK